MTMRPRGGAAAAPRRGTRAGGVRALYEDFRPVSEWKQDDESHILIFLIYEGANQGLNRRAKYPQGSRRTPGCRQQMESLSGGFSSSKNL